MSVLDEQKDNGAVLLAAAVRRLQASPETIITGLSNMQRLVGVKNGIYVSAVLVSDDLSLRKGLIGKDGDQMLIFDKELSENGSVLINGVLQEIRGVSKFSSYCTQVNIKYRTYPRGVMQSNFGSDVVTIIIPERMPFSTAVASQVGLFMAGLPFEILKSTMFHQGYAELVLKAVKKDIFDAKGLVKSEFMEDKKYLFDIAELFLKRKQRNTPKKTRQPFGNVLHLTSKPRSKDSTQMKQKRKQSFPKFSVPDFPDFGSIVKPSAGRNSFERERISKKRDYEQFINQSPMGGMGSMYASPRRSGVNKSGLSRSSPPHDRISMNHANNNNLFNNTNMNNADQNEEHKNADYMKHITYSNNNNTSNSSNNLVRVDRMGAMDDRSVDKQVRKQVGKQDSKENSKPRDTMINIEGELSLLKVQSQGAKALELELSKSDPVSALLIRQMVEEDQNMMNRMLDKRRRSMVMDKNNEKKTDKTGVAHENEEIEDYDMEGH